MRIAIILKVGAQVGDLHVHTNESDGSLSPLEVIALASRVNLKTIAITNHDYITKTGKLTDYANSLAVNLVEGVELSAFDYDRNQRVHILCYLPQNILQIQAICDSTLHDRTNAGLEMIEKVSSIYPITVEDVLKSSAGSTTIYKQHITKVLMYMGYCTGIFGTVYSELFNGKTGTCKVEYRQPNVYDVLEAAKASRGVSVLAHPYTYNSIDLMDELIAQNLLDGIEVRSSKTTLQQEAYLYEVATRHNLIKTGGSDFHGACSYKESPLGVKTTSQAEIQAIFDLSNSRK